LDDAVVTAVPKSSTRKAQKKKNLISLDDEGVIEVVRRKDYRDKQMFRAVELKIGEDKLLVRDKADAKAVVQKKAEHSREKKKEEKLERQSKDKERSKKKRSVLMIDIFDEIEYHPKAQEEIDEMRRLEEEIPEEKAPTVVEVPDAPTHRKSSRRTKSTREYQYSKEERKAFRQFHDWKKRNARKKKKERQAQRKAEKSLISSNLSTESTPIELEQVILEDFECESSEVKFETEAESCTSSLHRALMRALRTGCALSVAAALVKFDEEYLHLVENYPEIVESVLLAYNLYNSQSFANDTALFTAFIMHMDMPRLDDVTKFIEVFKSKGGRSDTPIVNQWKAQDLFNSDYQPDDVRPVTKKKKRTRLDNMWDRTRDYINSLPDDSDVESKGGRSRPHDVLKRTRDYINSLPADSDVESLETESYHENISYVASSLHRVIASPAIESVRQLVITLFSLKIFPLDTAKYVYSTLGKPQHMSIIHAIEHMLHCLAHVVRMGELYLSGNPLSTLLMSDNPYDSVLRALKSDIAQSQNIYIGIPREHCYSADEVRCNLKEHLSVASVILKKLNPLTAQHDILLDMFHKAEKVYDGLCRKLNTQRITPYGLVFHGAPQIGKSSCIEMSTKVLSAVLNKEHDHHMVFSRNCHQDYWDGYEGQPVVHFSEVGSKKDSQLAAKGDPAMEEITSLIDSRPYMLNMADVDKKATVFFTSLMVVIDTNDKMMGVKSSSAQPGAIIRRFVFVEPKPLERYATNGKLDPSKCNDDAAYYDRWTFTVQRGSCTGVKMPIFETLHKDMSSSDFRKWLYDDLQAHYEREERIMAGRENIIFSHDDFTDVSDLDSDLGDFSDDKYDDDENYPIIEYEVECAQFINDSVRVAKARWFLSWLYINLQWTIVTCAYTAVSLCLGIFDMVVLKRTDSEYFPLAVASLLSFSVVLTLHSYWALFYLMAFVCLSVLCVKKSDIEGRLTLAIHLSIMHLWENTVHRWRIFSDVWIGKITKNTFFSSKVIALSAAIGVLGTLLYLSRFVEEEDGNKERDSLSSEGVAMSAAQRSESNSDSGSMEHSFSNGYNISCEPDSDDALEDDIADVADPYVYKDTVDFFPVKRSTFWGVRELPAPEYCTESPDVLQKIVHKNLRNVYIKYPGKMTYRQYCLGVCENFMIMHAHSFHNGIEGATLHIGVTAVADISNCNYQVTIGDNNYCKITNDILMVKVNFCFTDILKYFPQNLVGHENVKCLIGNVVTMARFIPHASFDDPKGRIDYDNVYLYNFPGHQKGDCGLPLLGNVGNSCILAIHSAGNPKSAAAAGIMLSQTQLKSAMRTLRGSFNMVSESIALYGGEPHSKSVVRHEDMGSIRYLGKVSSPSLNMGSKLERTILAPELPDLFYDTFGVIVDANYVKPTMKPRWVNKEYVSPLNVGYRKLATTKISVEPNTMDRVIDCIVAKFLDNLEAKDISLQLTPVSLDVAINGDISRPYYRRIDTTKAGGFGFPGSKSKYLVRTEEDNLVHDEPTKELVSSVRDIISTYESGVCASPIFNACLKDEPRLAHKNDKGAVRVFYAIPFDYYLVMRMYLMPFYALMVEYSDDFYTCVGIDIVSSGHAFISELEEFSELGFEGDFGGFDVRMPIDVSVAAAEIICRVLSVSGYSKKDLKIVSGILTDGIRCNINFWGDLLVVMGMQPSGKYATAEDNSLKVLVLMVYVWEKITTREGKFFDYVLPRTYGDDIAASVKEEIIDEYNMVLFSDEMALLGLEFTTAAKNSVTDKFIPTSDISFLKRTFREHPDLGFKTSCLDLESIYKSLQWRLPSKSVSECDQMVSCVNSNLQEVFLWVIEKKFNHFRDSMEEILRSNYEGAKFTLVTYEVLLERLCPETRAVLGGGRPTLFEDEASISTVLVGFECECISVEEVNFGSGRLSSLIQWPAKTNFAERKAQLLEELGKFGENFKFLSRRDVLKSQSIMTNRDRYLQAAEYFDIVAEIDSIDLTERTMERSKARKLLNMGLESGELAPGDMEQVHENVDDVGGAPMEQDMSSVDFQFSVGQSNDLDVADFFARPVEIANLTLTPGVDLTYSVDLYSAWLSNASVRAKLKNYAYFRGDLWIRIAISASPFHYSIVQVSYQPFADFNENLINLEPELVTARRQAVLSYLSQSRYYAEINVRDNQPHEMLCPFISPKPMMRLFNTTPLVIADTSEYDDATSFGRLYINSLNQLASASSSPTDVTIFVYAWAEDVQLGAPTGTVIQLSTEAGPVDEREVGPVEKIASRLATMSAYLTAVPQIAPLAAASTMFFSGISGVASWFGWSYPVMNNEPHRVNPQPFQNGANTIGYDTGKRITLDPKQELTIDPRVVRGNEDEMSLAYINSRSSLFDIFQWLASDAALGSAIWTVPVTPRASKRYSIGIPDPYLVQPTSLAFAATPFYYWRGDITYRFQIVCSQYHRGKLAIYFEPNISQNAVIDATLDLNKQYIQIIDIQETQEFEVTIGWAYPRAWAKNLPNDLYGDLGSVAYLGPDLEPYSNGYIAVVPFTALQSPDGSDIEINVYVKSDNMAYNQFSHVHMPQERYSTEAAAVPDTYLNQSTATMDNISSHHFGEQPVSFRSLLKRFSTPDTGVATVPGSGGTNVLVLDKPIFPQPVPSYSVGTTDFVGTNLFGYLRYAYLGLRGGLRHRFGLIGDYTIPPLSSIRCSLVEPLPYATSTSFRVDTHDVYFSSIMEGTIEERYLTNSGIEFETPLYTNNLFLMSFSDVLIPNNTNFENEISSYFRVAVPVTSIDTLTCRYTHTIASAEDFTFLHYSGAPSFVVP